jgi:hypothetical protein
MKTIDFMKKSVWMRKLEEIPIYSKLIQEIFIPVYYDAVGNASDPLERALGI